MYIHTYYRVIHIMIGSVVYSLIQDCWVLGSPKDLEATAPESPNRASPVSVFKVYLKFVTLYSPDLPKSVNSEYTSVESYQGSYYNLRHILSLMYIGRSGKDEMNPERFSGSVTMQGFILFRA